MKIPKFVPIVVLAVLALFFWQGRAEPVPDNGFELAPPGFVGAAAAEEADVDALEAIADEAGMSAYFKVEGPIDLSTVRPLFRTIEDETATYIIGSVPVSGYGESEDVHAYVDVDGWFLAYYLESEGRSTGDVMDWIAYDDSGMTELTTKMENVVEALASAAGVTYTDSTHYHFQMPNATNMAVLIEHTTSSGEFDFSIPGEWEYLERSYSLAWYPNPDPALTELTFTLNGEEIYTHHEDGDGWHDYAATINATKMPPDTTHTAAVSGVSTDTIYASIVLLYRVP